ncbi:hypothetical protein OSB04_026156 [Centaurea solstitialis]|uniref:Uncharacterized protein n=1 Tax=Centaurea solstitialis TaxID=347529 RepID=A0AA38SNY3_9ASTR|nr:hypothetical protein OSB04_026156 [Centaurea solstitialis]
MRCKVLEKPKAKQNKGLWSPDEDQKLTHYVTNYGHASWTSVLINAGVMLGVISNILAFLTTTRFGATRAAGSRNTAVKRARVGVVPGWVTSWEVLTRKSVTSQATVVRYCPFWRHRALTGHPYSLTVLLWSCPVQVTTQNASHQEVTHPGTTPTLARLTAVFLKPAARVAPKRVVVRNAKILLITPSITPVHGRYGIRLRWSQIAQPLTGRTNNEIKNYWHSHLKKRAALASTKPSSSCLDTFNFPNGSSSEKDELTPSVSQNSNLPRVLFSDWINIGQFQHEFGKLNGDHQQLTHVNSWVSNKESIRESNESQNCISTSSKEDVFHAQVTLDQIFNFNDEDLISFDDLIYM